mmetsp:Transcript_52344/g.124981  ORF Transcript_52344/g.124981 Transcript_52344/m.124981 type:complete len:601 (+) Transcript_52344:97-1899(+)
MSFHAWHCNLLLVAFLLLRICSAVQPPIPTDPSEQVLLSADGGGGSENTNAKVSVTCTLPAAANCTLVHGSFVDGATVHATFKPVPIGPDGLQVSSGTSGFATLEVVVKTTFSSSSGGSSSSAGSYSDARLRKAAFAAGFAEGLLTAPVIPAFFYNDVPFGHDGPSEGVLSYVKTSINWIRDKCKSRRSTDDYWRAVGLVLDRFDGIVAGYSLGQSTTPGLQALDALDFLWLNLNGDLFDLIPGLSPGGGSSGSFVQVGRSWLRSASADARPKMTQQKGSFAHCSGLIRLSDDLKELFFGHSTWDTYATSAPRIYKYVTLPWKQGGQVVFRTQGYASSPGFLGSIDDWYTLQDVSSDGAQLVVMETSSSMDDRSAYAHLTPSSVFCWIRALVANGLATDAPSWPVTFSKEKSGTYNAQWLVLDVRKFVPGSPLPSDSLWVAEEVPGLVHAEDQTAALNSKKYFASYNDFMYSDTRKVAGISTRAPDPREASFLKLHGLVKSVADLQRVMGWSARAPLGGIQSGAIALRGDLLTPPSFSGAIDSKVSSATLLRRSLTSLARAGPSPDDGGPFCWPEDAKTRHKQHPACFDSRWDTFASSLA